MGYIDFRKNALDIINFIRAQAEPYPGAYYYLSNGKKIIINKVSKADREIEMKELGLIIKNEDTYYVRCNDSVLQVDDYRLA